MVRENWNLVREKSGKCQGILFFLFCGNPVNNFRQDICICVSCRMQKAVIIFSLIIFQDLTFIFQNT